MDKKAKNLGGSCKTATLIAEVHQKELLSPMNRPQVQIDVALKTVREVARLVQADNQHLADQMAQVIRQVEIIEKGIRKRTRQIILENARAGEPRQSDTVSRYELGRMPSRRLEAIIEHRITGAQPFRCPVDVYIAAAAALAVAPDPLKFTPLLRAVSSRLKTPVPAYQLRLCLRFWSHLGLVTHRRARFVAEHGHGHVELATAALRKLQKRPLQIGAG